MPFQISDECANDWVHDMKPVGLHWTKEETTNAMRSMGYNMNENDFYVVANMMYNDYYDIVKDDESMALKMAYDWLNDTDANDDKLYDYWQYIVKR